ncbi:Imm53 family immunity protein [Streptomyces sp. 135]|uniref:Imm53 family immunity protein n=1 Tax=Streptomyces sp. 135 TaxID=2838850 RepID=UPI001CBCE60D|nr:Imm53 family immunity protein [Streptomyces sp. 135]
MTVGVSRSARFVRQYGAAGNTRFVYVPDPGRPALLDWLQNWYARQCDGDWEHEWSVEIAP